MKIEMLIDELQEIVDEAFTLPLSGGKTVVNTERLTEIIDEMRANIPTEMKQAKRIVAERNTIVSKAKEEAEGIVQNAEERAKTMVAQSEIVKQAQQKAGDIIFKAETQASEIKKAANGYIDGLMKKADEELSKNLADLKKTRQSLSQYRQSGDSKPAGKK